MDIYDYLPHEDKVKLVDYINYYGGSSEGDAYDNLNIDNLKHFLRYWSTNKEHLFKMFDNQFILRKPIFYEQSYESLLNEMEKAIWGYQKTHKNIKDFTKDYYRKIESLDLDIDDIIALKDLLNESNLVTNVYEGDSILIKGTDTVNGKPLQINKGCKVVKMIGKIVKAIGIEKDVYECDKCGEAIAEPNGICPNCGCKKVKVMTNYEKFRREHSLILNQKILRGNLCLSIHPLDYITMSDNACGWDSCMRWMDDPGDYRLGTIEMMMSKYVVVAYLESKDNMIFCHTGYEWNSKRWRQLIVVTPELILANKQYPYENDTLQGAAIKWMRDLAETDTNFGPYQKEACQIENHSNNQIGEHKVRITLNFNYMYNDIYYTRLSYVQEGFNKDCLEYNLSGPAICTSCFEEIPYDTVDPSGTVCRNCGGQFRCDCCGGWHYGEPYYDNGNTYCEYCYYNELEECEICGSRYSSDEIQTIFIHLADTEDQEIECENWSYCISVCDCCINSRRFFKLFGPVYTNIDMWGRTRKCVSVANFTDAGFRSGNLSQWDINYLTKVRDAGNNEDRIALIKENLC